MRTILIVDDEATVIRVLRRALEKAGYEVLTARNGLEALECLAKATPDVMVTDIEMPKMTGYELCRALKADPALDFLPVILLTAKASSESKIEGLHEGADDYLTKPFDARR